jgi:flagellar motility protein MotE (MotC chaperone)
MDHDYLEKLKQTHPTLRLLAADNAPLIISFLYRVFIQPNQRSVLHSEISSRLEDYLFHLRDIHGEGKYPKPARQYLEDWAGGRTPFLRKYYTDLSDEPEFDLTPATEKAIEWLQSLEERQFIGTESRLLTVFELLREIVRKTRQDPEVRIAELERQRAEINAEIDKIRSGVVDPYDPTQIKERYFQVEETARRLLADFRQVEYNFRGLDRETRERIATSDKTKGTLLDEIFQEQDVIWDSDQGKSFHAFWEFLMSAPRQAELAELLETVYALEEIRSLEPDAFLAGIKFSLLDAGEKVYKTNNLLVEQLRKYLDDQAYLENRRIMDLVRGIEKLAVELKDAPPSERAFAELDDIKPALDLVMSRGLFVPPKNPEIEDVQVIAGEAAIEVEALYRQNYVDEAELRANIRRALQTRSQVSLRQLVDEYPVRKGLAEVVTYLSLADKDDKALVADDETETFSVTTENGRSRQIELPKLIFTC